MSIYVAFAATLAVGATKPRTLQITTVTTGPGLPVEGYYASLWQVWGPGWDMSYVDDFVLPVNGTLSVAGLVPGQDYLLEVIGAGPNCEFVGPIPRQFTVGGWWDPGVAVEIDIDCAPPVRLSFANDAADGNAEIYLVNSNGTDAARLTFDPARDVAPAWSPDGTMIAFQSDRSGAPEIHLMNADGSNQVQLTATGGSFRPAWSPDGARIAFTSTRDGNSEVYAVNLDGSGLVNLTNNPAEDADPAWSSDGTKVAFRSDRDQSPITGIYLMNADGSGVIRLTREPYEVWDAEPAWSPDGTSLAISRSWCSELCVQVIVRMSAADGSAEQLTAPGSWCETHTEPSWAPDGRKIVFTSTDWCGGVPTVSVLNLSETGFYYLSGAALVAGFSPSWRP